MKIEWNNLRHLPVQTESGQKIGIVEGVTVDVNSHAVDRYEVKPAMRLATLFAKHLLIAPAEVVSINSEVMIVKDSVAAREPMTNSEKTRIALRPAKPEIDMSELE